MARGFTSGAGFGGGGFSNSSLSYLFEPPDLSAISDANVVVDFKGLLKKDATTKAKALEDLIAHAQAHPFERGGTEDAVLDVWVALYARTSIDNSRRVRELSHALQLELMRSARKRMEKRIPSIVGPWLAGSFDRDRGVARAATEGLTSFLNTEEKMNMFWRKCHRQILEFATEAIKETPDTLSDERSTTKEDAQAKYYRVMGSGLSLMLNLVQRVEIETIQDGLEGFLSVNAVWALAGAEDSFVRRTLYKMIQTCLNTAADLLEPRLPQIGRVLVADSLKSSQLGSALDLVQVLTSLTKRFPEVWKTKTPPLDRLRPFAEKGSQGSSWAYWQELDTFLAIVPTDKLTTESATLFLRAMRTGMSSREEHRANAVYAWACYINSFERFMSLLSPDVDFVQMNIYPLTDHYLHPTASTSSWVCTEPKLIPKSWEVVVRQGAKFQSSVESSWGRFADALCSRMSNSLPEVSADFKKSQDAIGEEGDRWFTLAAAILSYRKDDAMTDDSKKLKQIVTSASLKVLRSARELLSTRNYKPFGSAAVIQSALTKSPKLLQDNEGEDTDGDVITSLYPTREPAAIEAILSSQSSSYLLSTVNALATIPGRDAQYKTIWTSLVDRALATSLSLCSLTQLLSTSSATDLARQHATLQTSLGAACHNCATAAGTSDDWKLFEATLQFDLLLEDQLKVLVTRILDALDDSAKLGTAMRALEIVFQRQAAAMSNDQQLHIRIVTKLLSLTEISNKAVSTKAIALRSLLDQHSGERSLVKIVQDNLDSASALSLGIDTLVRQASAGIAKDKTPLKELFPSSNVWMTELSVFFQQAPPNPSLSLTSNIGGAYFLVKHTGTPTSTGARRDRKGRSIPARMGLYTTKLLPLVEFETLSRDIRIELLFLLYLTVELASDQLSNGETEGLWTMSGEVEDFISSSRRIFNDIVADAEDWRRGNNGDDSLIEGLLAVMLRESKGTSASALYSAKALSNLLQALTEARGIPDADARISSLEININRPAPASVLPLVGLITGFGDALGSSKLINTMCNKFVSNITGAFPGLESTLYSMILLNAVLPVYEVGEIPVDNRRLAIALKQMTSWTDTPEEMSSGLAAETCKALQRIVRNVKDTYGLYWEQAIAYCLRLWSHAARDPPDAHLPYLFSSIKLMMTLETLDDPNDDLVEALETNRQAISSGLIGLLKIPREDSSQPGELVDALLCRRVSRIPLEHLKDISDLYGLIPSDSRDIQTAVFGLLHRALPEQQKELSTDVLLDKTEERLPDELLSLLLDAPTLEAYSDDVLTQFPTAVRSYLLAWHLIFDAMDAAAHKLRNDYADHLKTEKAIDPLLEFIFDVLGHSASHPLRLDKENLTDEHIRYYDIILADAEAPERSMQWLMVHLYYQALKYVPGQFKAWYISCRSKQTKIAVESWTTKYFSPLIISEALDSVAEWQTQQEEPEEDEVKLNVRVGRKTKEVIAGYEVDELEAAIAIRIPASYPLDNITVEGIKRVACSEGKWQSWLMATQGVIVFSGGSIADGLATFRRNVNGALKGQTECAICYSIVSSDKRMPDKRCSTCRNAFHRVCLYKWFQTSNQNTCPLCRNPIDYLGASDRRTG